MVETTPLGKWSGRGRTNLRLVLLSPRDKMNLKGVGLSSKRRSDAGSESREMCGNRCRKKVFSCLRSDWAGEPEAGRGGSAIRHECKGVGTIAGMAAGKRLHGSRDGKYRFVLETGVQHFRRTPEDYFGESGTGEGAPRQEDRSER